MMENRNRAVGFGSPAESYVETKEDWNKRLFPKPHAMYSFRIIGKGFSELGIFDNDIVIIDTSCDPGPGKIIAILIDGEINIGRLDKSLSISVGDNKYPLKSKRVVGTITRVLRILDEPGSNN